MALPDDITQVLEARLGVPQGMLGPRGLERLRILGRIIGGRDDRPIPDEVYELAEVLGFDAERLEAEAGTMRRFLSSVIGRPELVPTVGQALVRALTRMIMAESEAIRIVLRDVAPEQRAAVLDQALAALLPLLDEIVPVLHRVLLREPLAAVLEPDRLMEPAVAPVAIAHVDVVGSTAYLFDDDAGDQAHRRTEELVDVLFAAAQRATLLGSTAVVKYVGDGVFLAGPDPADVAAAALDTIGYIQAELPVQVRAGMAYGPVVRRAGDYFGLPVALAETLTKEADRGALLATPEAAAKLADTLRLEPVRVKLPRTNRRIDAVRVGLGEPAPPEE